MKKITKTLFGLLGGVVGLSCALCGCATVGDIKNSDSELIYNGNSATMIDGYLYYGNSFANDKSFEKDEDYKNATKISYLSRLNTNIDLASTTKDYSPKCVEKVAEEVTAQTKSFMFALGNHIYYATPNRQKLSGEDGKSNFYFNYTTIYRSDLNGDNQTKIYSTNGEVSQIEALKYNNKYYIVLLAGENLVKIEIGNKTSTEVISEHAKSVAIPKTYQKKEGSTLSWNGDIYFTVDKSDEDSETYLSGSVVKKVSVAGGDAKSVFFKNGATISFVGRERDVMFYTMTGDQTEVFKFDAGKVAGQVVFGSLNDLFYSASSISDVKLVATNNVDYGYIFTTSSGKIGYSTKDGNVGVINLKNGEDSLSSYKILLLDGRTLYLSTTTGIFKANISEVFNGNGGSVDVACQTIASMTAIYDGSLYAFDGQYIYYYAKLETIESDDEEESTEESTEETDDTYYLYRANVDAENAYQLLSLTQFESRHSK